MSIFGEELAQANVHWPQPRSRFEGALIQRRSALKTKARPQPKRIKRTRRPDERQRDLF
jgi:hypothetical protein